MPKFMVYGCYWHRCSDSKEIIIFFVEKYSGAQRAKIYNNKLTARRRLVNANTKKKEGAQYCVL
jgi:hypothetical protein